MQSLVHSVSEDVVFVAAGLLYWVLPAKTKVLVRAKSFGSFLPFWMKIARALKELQLQCMSYMHR